jgi:hypothetical protein
MKVDSLCFLNRNVAELALPNYTHRLNRGLKHGDGYGRDSV